MKGKDQFQQRKEFNIHMVDDDPEDRDLFREALAALDLDIHVSTTKNGKEALNFLKSADTLPDILFLDLNMPVMNGLECLQKIRSDENYKDICIAIYSTSSGEEEIEQTLVLGANVYIKKPSDFEELKSILKKLVTFNGHCTEPYLKKEFFMMSLGT